MNSKELVKIYDIKKQIENSKLKAQSQAQG
jgi:hypothetical protein